MERRDNNGAVQARVDVRSLGSVAPEGTAFPTEWEGELATGSYRLVWGALGYGAVSAEFPVVEGEWTLLHANYGAVD